MDKATCRCCIARSQKGLLDLQLQDITNKEPGEEKFTLPSLVPVFSIKGEFRLKAKIYYKFLLVFRTASGTFFQFSILKHKLMDQFQPLFTQCLFPGCLLILSNVCTQYPNLYIPFPSFVLKFNNFQAQHKPQPQAVLVL